MSTAARAIEANAADRESSAATSAAADLGGAESVPAASAPAKKNWLLSLDSWAVVAAFAAALLIRAGVFKHVPW